jgi:hypothetical protein
MGNFLAEDDLKLKAEHCLDVMNTVKNTILDSLKAVDCLEKEKDCLIKLNIFSQSAEILKDIFKIEE